MSVAFELATPTRIVFGAGAVAQAVPVLREAGASRVLVVTGKAAERAAPLTRALDVAGLAWLSFSIHGEPTVDVAREGTARALSERCDAVVGFGGGSVLDAAKAIAILATHGGDPLEHLEVIGRGKPIVGPGLPFIAVPTTAGTGAEVTKNAVLGSKETGVKASLRSPFMLARVALVDPELLAGLPPAVLAASGLDALAQLIEPLVSARANPFTDALAREGIRRSARSLRRAVLEGADASLREDLALASLFGGLCLANAGLGAVHGFAAPIGGSFDAPHGAVCAALLAPVLAANYAALLERAPEHPAVPRFREVAALVTGKPTAEPADAVTWVRDLCRDLAIPPLRRYGMSEADVPALITKARAASSMKANPIALTDAELAAVLTEAIGSS